MFVLRTLKFSFPLSLIFFQILTGSADASIKLWSILSPQRCLHTFTHHTESVWSLFSSHPSLEIFYSGDRSGLVCKVDVEDCKRVVEGECAVICKDTGDPNMAASEGVTKIIAMDDNLLWTASGSSNIKRWRVPQRRVVRASSMKEPESPFPGATFSPRIGSKHEQRQASQSNFSEGEDHKDRDSTVPSINTSMVSSTTSLAQELLDEENRLYGLPYSCLVKLTAPGGTHTSYGFSRSRDGDIATLYSAASVLSVPKQVRSPTSTSFPTTQAPRSNSNLDKRDTLSLPPSANPYRVKGNPQGEYEEREVAVDAVPLNESPDEVIVGDHGLVRVTMLNNRMHALTVNTAGEVAVWDVIRGCCYGVFSREDVLAAFVSSTSFETGPSAEKRTCSPRQALEVIKERIEGEAVVSQWAVAETKIGELSIQLMDRCFEAEIYADEAGYGPERPFNDDQRRKTLVLLI